MMNNTIYNILKGGAVLLLLAVTSCHQQYEPLSNRAYITQTELKVNQYNKVVVGKDKPGTAEISIRVSDPLKTAAKFEIAIDDKVLEEYNKRNETTFEALPEEQFELLSKSIEIPAGQSISGALKINIKPWTEEMLESGKKFAIGIRLVSADSDVIKIANGADKYMIIIGREAVQNVMEFNKASNIHLKMAQEHVLTNWTLEFMVNISWLDKREGKGNNQALFGAWANGGSEIYVRFGDATIKGNQLQLKRNGTHLSARMEFEAGKWYHVAYVCDNTQVHLYVNGKLEESFDVSPATTILSKTPQLGNNESIGLKANVKMAQLRIWNIARTQRQIEENMTSLIPTTEGLLGYWRFDEGTGNTFKDATTKNPEADTQGETVVWLSLIHI